jgi:5'-3' exonuclease
MTDRIVLIDADTLCYLRIEDLDEYKTKVDEIISKIIIDSNSKSYRVFLEAIGNQTFRKVSFNSYKINRANKELPINYFEIKKYITSEWKPFLSMGVESDDSIISTWRYIKEEMPFTDVLLAVQDKDFKTYPVNIFDTYKSRYGATYSISEEESKYNFALQMIMGDSSDGVSGIKGVGEKGAIKILDTYKGKNLNRCVYKAYLNKYGYKVGRQEIIKNTFLLRLRDDVRPCKVFHNA